MLREESGCESSRLDHSHLLITLVGEARRSICDEERFDGADSDTIAFQLLVSFFHLCVDRESTRSCAPHRPILCESLSLRTTFRDSRI